MPRALPDATRWLRDARSHLHLTVCPGFEFEITAHEGEPPFVLCVTKPGDEDHVMIRSIGRVLTNDMSMTEVVRAAYNACAEILLYELSLKFRFNSRRPYASTMNVVNLATNDYPEYHDIRTDQHWDPETARREVAVPQARPRVPRRSRRAGTSNTPDFVAEDFAVEWIEAEPEPRRYDLPSFYTTTTPNEASLTQEQAERWAEWNRLAPQRIDDDGS